MLEKREGERGNHMLVCVRVVAAQTEAGGFLFLGLLECTQRESLTTNNTA